MSRIITAVYRSYAVAALVRGELEQIGVPAGDIVVIPDADEPASEERPRENRQLMDAVSELDLPDSDTRDYQQCVRRGDYVVSATVGSALVEEARKIMRNPEAEARNLDALAQEFEHTQVVRHSVRPARAGTAVAPDADAAHPYIRSYHPADRRR